MSILLPLLISALVTSPSPEPVMLHTMQAQVARLVLPSEDQILMSVETLSVPMIDVGGRPALALTLNGKGPYTFIVDTGANITVVDPVLIAQLALPSLAGTPGVGPVRIAEVGIGSLKITNMTAGRSPGLLTSLSAEPPRGVLSALAFPGALISFDFPAKQIHIRKGALGAADGRLDTVLVEKGRVRLANGEFPRFEAPFAGTAMLGEHHLHPGVLSFSDMRAGATPGRGVIGMALLREFVLTLDSKNRRISVVRPRER